MANEKQWKSALDGKDLSRLPEPVQSAMNRLDTYPDLRLLGKDWETVVDALLAAHAQARKAGAWLVTMQTEEGPTTIALVSEPNFTVTYHPNTGAKPASPPARENADELAKIIEYLAGEGYEPFGLDGDRMGWSTSQTVILALRELAALKDANEEAAERTEWSLEQVRDWHRRQSAQGYISQSISDKHHAMANAIDEAICDHEAALDVSKSRAERLDEVETALREVTLQRDALRERSALRSHSLYETGDRDAPENILDSNGDVVLGLCRRCGRGESELTEPCEPSNKTGTLPPTPARNFPCVVIKPVEVERAEAASSDLVEIGAKAIFGHWRFAAPLPWVDRGNSLKQEEARDFARAVLGALPSALRESKAPLAHPMSSAPRDGKLLRLLVRFDEHHVDDSPEPLWTVGFNDSDLTGIDEWNFAGWCWSHDHFTEGKGTPVGWLPLHSFTAVNHIMVHEALANCPRTFGGTARFEWIANRLNEYLENGTPNPFAGA